MNWIYVADVVGATMMLFGAAFTFIAALGLVRLPDLFSRTHAAAKPQMLGLMLMMGGLVLMTRSWGWAGIALAVLAIQMIAAPVGSHLLGRSAYRSGLAKTATLIVDELDPDLEDSERPKGAQR